MPTAGDLITGSLRALNVIGATETPAAADLALGLTVLNRMVARWRIKRLLIFTVARTVHPLTATVSTYTIGPGGDFDQARPNWITDVGVVPNRNASPPVLEVPLGPTIAAGDYADIPQKTLAGAYPIKVHYDRAFIGTGLGRVIVWPVPTTGDVDLVLYTPTAMQNFADLFTDYNLPDGFWEALHYNLAIRLANEGFSARVPEDVRIEARASLNDLQLASVDVPEALFSRALVGRRGRGRGDIRTGGV